jgi:hypothetical protein
MSTEVIRSVSVCRIVQAGILGLASRFTPVDFGEVVQARIHNWQLAHYSTTASSLNLESLHGCTPFRAITISIPSFFHSTIRLLSTSTASISPTVVGGFHPSTMTVFLNCC